MCFTCINLINIIKHQLLYYYTHVLHIQLWFVHTQDPFASALPETPIPRLSALSGLSSLLGQKEDDHFNQPGHCAYTYEQEPYQPYFSQANDHYFYDRFPDMHTCRRQLPFHHDEFRGSLLDNPTDDLPLTKPSERPQHHPTSLSVDPRPTPEYLSPDEILKIRKLSNSRKNLAAKLVRALFSIEERASSNVRGRGKAKLDTVRMEFVETSTFNVWPLESKERHTEAWSSCISAIDEANRRLNRNRK